MLDDKALEAALDAYIREQVSTTRERMAATITAYLAALDPREQTLQRRAADLIIRQQQEIDRLKKELGVWRDDAING